MNFKKRFLFLYIYTIFGTLKLIAGHAFSAPIINKVANNYFKLTYQGYKNLLEERMNNHENLNSPPYKSKSPLLNELIEKQYNDLVEIILENQSNINLNEIVDCFKSTYAHTAVLYNNPLALKILLDKKADIDSEDSIKSTPLLRASCGGYLACIKLLVSAGANVNKPNHYQSTPLNECIEYAPDPIPCIQYLLCNNANPNITNWFGASPLIAMVQNRIGTNSDERKALAKLLVTFGANIYIRAGCCGSDSVKIYKTASEIARIKKQNILADYIELYAQQRDKLIKQIKYNQPINYAEISLDLSRLKDTKGNNLAYHALRNNNFNVLSKLMYLRPEMIVELNFAGQAPIDIIPKDKDLETWLACRLNNAYWMQKSESST